MVMTSMPAAAQFRVRVDVAVVRDDDTGLDGEHVVAVVPLLAIGLHVVAARGEHAERAEAERTSQRREEVGGRFDDEPPGTVAGPDRPGAGVSSITPGYIKNASRSTIVMTESRCM